MKLSTELATIDPADLVTVNGGMRWQGLCASYNVEDRRPGHPTKLEQRRQTDEWNRARGCPTWADLHPKKR